MSCTRNLASVKRYLKGLNFELNYTQLKFKQSLLARGTKVGPVGLGFRKLFSSQVRSKGYRPFEHPVCRLDSRSTNHFILPFNVFRHDSELPRIPVLALVFNDHR